MRVNGKIRAHEVRVIGFEGRQLGVFQLNDALNLARQQGVDLVEISSNAIPPVCRLVELGKFRYEQAKKDKESRKRQNASTVKEVQISPRIDAHDLSIKLMHTIGFLCEDMKVKVVLKFKGREMAHTEVGFGVINKFIAEIAPYGHLDFQPKLVGKAVTLMISPLPRAKRAKNPYAGESGSEALSEIGDLLAKPAPPVVQPPPPAAAAPPPPAKEPVKDKVIVSSQPPSGGLNTPFADLKL